MPEFGVLLVNLLQQGLDDRFFVAAGGRINPLVAFFQLIALVDQQRHVATVVNDEFRTFTIRELDGVERAIPIFFERFALPGEHRHAGFGDRRRSVVLRRENVAARPSAHGRAEVHQRFNPTPRVRMVMCNEPVTRTPLSGLVAAYFLRMDIRPGISASAMLISLRPESQSERSRTLVIMFRAVAVFRDLRARSETV